MPHPMVYTLTVASLQPVHVRGHTYYRIVESRRINGKPRPVPVLYLGSADAMLARHRAEEQIRISSKSHGAVAAVWSVAADLGLTEVVDRHLKAFGRRVSRHRIDLGVVGAPPKKNDGLTVGQSLTLVAVGRACHATSKRGFAEWAASTTLNELARVDVQRLTSQHFWDQMDQIREVSIEAIERDVIQRVLQQFQVPLDTLLYDATNFYTFIASTNRRSHLARRGHNKQKRDDLRQVSVALLCTREHGIPLWHQTYEGQVTDTKSFDVAVPAVLRRMEELKIPIDTLTLVFDKGNVSRANQRRVDESKLHYLTGLTVASQKDLVARANQALSAVALSNEQTVMAYRTKETIWGRERTAVVLVSETLRDGQIKGILQHVASAKRWLTKLADTLDRGKQKRSRAAIEQDIKNRLKGRQHLREVLHYELRGEDPKLTLTYEFSQESLDRLARETLGRLILVTDRHDWSTREIIESYRIQAVIEALFAHLKDLDHVSLRPPFHWTDQKLRVHVLTCVWSHLLSRLLHLKAERAGVHLGSQEKLLDVLEKVRRATILRFTGHRGKPRLTTQLEELDPKIASLLPALGVGC